MLRISIGRCLLDRGGYEFHSAPPIVPRISAEILGDCLRGLKPWDSAESDETVWERNLTQALDFVEEMGLGEIVRDRRMVAGAESNNHRKAASFLALSDSLSSRGPFRGPSTMSLFKCHKRSTNSRR
ncbi:hypothetical protein Bpet4632 [Bordetella petrii]|uniref:Uncharacterized protein n=1 Tax=Bordetella petrii (strain ATCC BAA-461 / DSM 12804 / CCUG 43448 / CIP 107267 / Se-1111R) TaxID=340100 RepID=A9IF75_BORPD|nr:hypothetical protein Bpet4632 [Bordetella petrii]